MEPAADNSQRTQLIPLLLTLGIITYEGMTLALNIQRHQYVFALLSALGLLAGLIATGLVLFYRLDLNRVNRLILGILGMWMLVEIVVSVRDPGEVEMSVYILHLMLVTFAFTVLQLSSAIQLAVGNFFLLAVLTLTRRRYDLALLNDIGFLTMIIGYLTAYGRQVRDQQIRTVQMENLARRDGLTNLLNRRTGQERLEHLMQQSPRPADVALVLLDVDNFKRLNDTYGHALGDEVLKRVACVLESQSRTGDLVCRWGGEEFLLILERVKPDDAMSVALRIQAEVSTLVLPVPRRVTLSGGVAMLKEAYSLSELLALVDRRLYAAKDAGRNRIVTEGELFQQFSYVPEQINQPS